MDKDLIQASIKFKPLLQGERFTSVKASTTDVFLYLYLDLSKFPLPHQIKKKEGRKEKEKGEEGKAKERRGEKG